MGNRPAVTVLIPHYGDPTHTMALVEQLRGQLGSHDLVVVDDASPSPFPSQHGVTVVRRHRNGGFGSAVNSGARRARGDLLLILNSDLVIPDDFVARMLEAHARFPASVLSPRVDNGAGEPVPVGRRYPRTSHHLVEWLTPLARWRGTASWHRGVGHVKHARGKDLEVDWVIGAAMLIPLALFRRVGGFDERFFMNSEEVDLQRRLRAIGVGSVALGAPCVMHEGGGSTPPPRRREWLTTSRLQYAGKWGSPRRLQAVLATATLVNFVVNLARRTLGRDLEPWRTARDELRLLRRPE